MANGHVVIYDLISNSNGHASTSDSACKTSSDTNGMEGTAEYRLLMAYASRRRARKGTGTDASHGGSKGDANGTAPSQTLTGTEEPQVTRGKKKKKKGWKRALSFFKCVKPQTEDDVQHAKDDLPDVNVRCFSPGSVSDEDDLDEVANRLTRLTDEIKLSPPEIESDDEDEVEVLIGLLLRDQGDQFNEQLKKHRIGPELFLNYGFFERMMNTLLSRIGYKSSDPSSLQPQASQKTQLAVTCEITSRLTAVDTLPMNRLMDMGSRYLRDYYSDWAQQQGGYEVAIVSDEEDVE